MTDLDAKQLEKGDKIFFAGSFFEVAEIKEFPHGIMIGIYDEKPLNNHIDYLIPQNVNQTNPCNNCQGGGCPVCSGFGIIVQNDFYPFDSQEDKDFQYEIMAECMEEERIEEEKRLKATNRILNALKTIKPTQWFQDLTDYTKEAEVHNPFKIVKKPRGNYQTENEFESLGGVWVDQSSSYPCEDCYYGTVTVKIDDKRYLEMPFAT